MRKRPPKRPETALRDVHAEITARTVAAIEAGAGDFQMPWHRPGASFAIPKNALTDRPYRGSNILSLWIDADEKRFERQIWATFKQYQFPDPFDGGFDLGSIALSFLTHRPRPKPSSATTELDCRSGTRGLARRFSTGVPA